MKLEEVVRLRGGPWKPEPPPDPSYLPDFRYTGIQSCFEVDGDVLAQLRQHFAATVEAHKPRTPVAWDRVLWDEPWEPPKPKKPEDRPPLIVAHSFDALAGYGREPMPAHGWLLPMGMAIHKVCQDASALGSLHADDEPGAYEDAWERFSQSSALSRFSPSPSRGLVEYTMDVEQVMQAAMSLRGNWYDFLDAAVVRAQHGMKLKVPPVFVVLFMDFEFAPGAADALVRSMRKMAHPRLLCLFAKEPDDVR